MKPTVWLKTELYPTALTRLEAAVNVIQQGNMVNLPGVDAVIINAQVEADGDFMTRAGANLKVIARPGIGVDNVDIPAATERGILVVNTPDAPTESTAEHTVALLLALAKRVVLGDMNARGADIAHSRLMGTETRGRQLGIVGFGRIGRRVAQICGLGLGMKIVVFDPYVAKSVLTDLGLTRADTLTDLLTEADFVSLHTALTPETRHLIAEPELRCMKPGAYLINASRGPIIDETALVKILQEGHLAGAALDVFDPEPPAPDNPLLKMDKVVLTPHIASYTDLGSQTMGEGAVEQVLQLLQGQRPPHLMNPDIWPGRCI